MKPAFHWEECGRQLVARFGNLSVSVRRVGSARRGDLRWFVGDVFGNGFAGLNEGAFADPESACRATEKIAIREANALARMFRRAKEGDET